MALQSLLTQSDALSWMFGTGSGQSGGGLAQQTLSAGVSESSGSGSGHFLDHHSHSNGPTSFHGLPDVRGIPHMGKFSGPGAGGAGGGASGPEPTSFKGGDLLHGSGGGDEQSEVSAIHEEMSKLRDSIFKNQDMKAAQHWGTKLTNFQDGCFKQGRKTDCHVGRHLIAA